MFSPRLPLNRLNEQHDTLAFSNLLGNPLPAARFMGGREFELLTSDIGPRRDFTEDDLHAVITKQSLLLPAFAPGGPFPARLGASRGPKLEKPREILARATLYLAMMTMTSTALIKTDGDLIIDGGFAHNQWYCRLLATLCGHKRCFVNHQSEGTAKGAGMLAVWNKKHIQWPLGLALIKPLDDPNLTRYVEHWQRLIND